MIKGADQCSELPVLLYCLLNKPDLFKMHEPELHLATLISKDKNKQLYIEQIHNINDGYGSKRPQKKQNELGKSEFEDEQLVEELVEDKKENKKEEKKSGFLSEYVDIAEEYSIYGLNNAIKFNKQQKAKNRSSSKGVVKKVIGLLGKGIKTGMRFVFTPCSEGKNMFDVTQNWCEHMFSGWLKKK